MCEQFWLTFVKKGVINTKKTSYTKSTDSNKVHAWKTESKQNMQWVYSSSTKKTSFWIVLVHKSADSP